MTRLEWLNEQKGLCERGIEFYKNKASRLERDLEAIKGLIDLVEGQPVDTGTAQ